jgi:hypothetical protein
MIYKKIPLSEIIINDDYRTSLKRERPSLLESIEKYGIRTPIIIIKEDKNYLLISGYKRFDIIKKLNINPIECKIIENPLSNCEKIIFNIDDNLALNELSLYEKINALIKLRENKCEKFIEYAHLLKIDPRIIKEIDFLKLPYAILMMIDRGDFDKKALTYFKYLNNEQIILLSDYFIRQQFTKSEKRKFIDNLLRGDEIGINITEFLQKNIYFDKSQIIKALNKIINPQTEKLKEKFICLQKELKGVKLSSEPYFENPNLKLEIRFKDFNILKKKLEKLNNQLKDKTGIWHEN